MEEREPPHPYEPPRRPGLSARFWAIFIIGALLLASAGGLALLARPDAGRQGFGSLIGSAPSVQIGTALAWREPLGALKSSQGLQLAIGDFDADGAEEAWLYEQYPRPTKDELGKDARAGKPLFHVVRPDGSIATHFFGADLQMLQRRGWDYDGDGRQDFMAMGVANNAQTNNLNPNMMVMAGAVEFYNLDGLRLGQVTGDYAHARIGDTNADGSADLFVQTSWSPVEYTAFGPQGKVLSKFNLPPDAFNPAFGDVDGDGKTDLLILDNMNNAQLKVILGSGGKSSLPGWTGYMWPGNCADADGDGLDEVFCAGSGYLNPASKAFTSFAIPVGNNSVDPMGEVLVCDLEADGINELVCTSSAFSMDASVYIFDLQGVCTYAERLGGRMIAAGVLKEPSGQDHLVVLTDEKFLIYP